MPERVLLTRICVMCGLQFVSSVEESDHDEVQRFAAVRRYDGYPVADDLLPPSAGRKTRAPPAQPVHYRVHWLGALTGFPYSKANDVNELGVVAGEVSVSSTFSAETSRAVFWLTGDTAPTEVTVAALTADPPIPAGLTAITAKRVNVAGEIVGAALDTITGIQHPYVYDVVYNTFTVVDGGQSPDDLRGWAINDVGDVAAWRTSGAVVYFKRNNSAYDYDSRKEWLAVPISDPQIPFAINNPDPTSGRAPWIITQLGGIIDTNDNSGIMPLVFSALRFINDINDSCSITGTYVTTIKNKTVRYGYRDWPPYTPDDVSVQQLCSRQQQWPERRVRDQRRRRRVSAGDPRRLGDDGGVCLYRSNRQETAPHGPLDRHNVGRGEVEERLFGGRRDCGSDRHRLR